MTINYFKHIVNQYYKLHKRDLPWRNTNNPYYILISEIMLQQTQVPRVLLKYPQFIVKFPTIPSLATASLQDVISEWQGLGYNRRAIYLKKIALQIVENHKGKLPNSYEELISLPGIGKNTAGSLLAFAFNTPVVFIETNIRRVFIHHFFSNQENIHDKKIIPLIEESLDKKNPREWYYALMDYGTYLGKATENPNRKSTHYKKQSPLKGSVREVRGIILKVMSQHPSVDFNVLQKLTGIDDERFRKAYGQLIHEGFLDEKNNNVKIKS